MADLSLWSSKGLSIPGTIPAANPELNVAGSRESKAPGIQELVRKVMLKVLRCQRLQAF